MSQTNKNTNCYFKGWDSENLFLFPDKFYMFYPLDLIGNKLSAEYELTYIHYLH